MVSNHWSLPSTSWQLQEVFAAWWFQTWLLFSISYMGCHPSHWLIFFQDGYCTTNQFVCQPGMFCLYIHIYTYYISIYIYIGHSMHPSSWSSPLASTFEASAFQGDHLNDQNVVVVSIDKSSLHWSLLNIQCVKIIHTKSYYINPHINQELIKPSPNESRVAPSNCR